MNSNVILPHSCRSRFTAARAASASELRFSISQAYGLLFGLLAVLGAYYVWILNANATRGYEFRQLETMQRELNLQRNLLGVTIAEFESLQKLSAPDGKDRMEPVDSPDYIVARPRDVALAGLPASAQ